MVNNARGVDIGDFVNSKWPEGYYYDSEVDVVDDDGTLLLEPDKLYNLDDFEFVYNAESESVDTFTHMFKKWKKNRNTTTLVVRIPKDQTEVIRKEFKERGFLVE